jgi:carbon-monoxide dehydrogenase catalytic subunit
MAEEKEAKSIDQGSLDLIEKAITDGANTAFDRAEAMKPCPIGSVGSCCKNCGMGPCRVPLAKGKEETGRKTEAAWHLWSYCRDHCCP